jgi:hypothetical protein
VSVHYVLVVPKGRWPSYRALNEAFERQGFPVEIVKPERALSGEPIGYDNVSEGLALRLDGNLAEVDANIEREHDYGRDLVDFTNADLERVGATFRMAMGDSTLSIELGDSMEEWIAACYLMATLVRDFGAYGYEDDEDTHGGAAWADLLVKGAECRFDYGEDEEGKAPEPAIATKPGLGIGNVVSIARWVIALAVIAYFAISSWMKAETALERQETAQVARP